MRLFQIQFKNARQDICICIFCFPAQQSEKRMSPCQMRANQFAIHYRWLPLKVTVPEIIVLFICVCFYFYHFLQMNNLPYWFVKASFVCFGKSVEVSKTSFYCFSLGCPLEVHQRSAVQWINQKWHNLVTYHFGGHPTASSTGIQKVEITCTFLFVCLTKLFNISASQKI